MVLGLKDPKVKQQTAPCPLLQMHTYFPHGWLLPFFLQKKQRKSEQSSLRSFLQAAPPSPDICLWFFRTLVSLPPSHLGSKHAITWFCPKRQNVCHSTLPPHPAFIVCHRKQTTQVRRVTTSSRQALWGPFIPKDRSHNLIINFMKLWLAWDQWIHKKWW